MFQPGFDSGSSDEVPQNPVTGVGGRARSHKSAAPGGSGGGSISRAVFALRRALRARAVVGRGEVWAAPGACCGGGPSGAGNPSRGGVRRGAGRRRGSGASARAAGVGSLGPRQGAARSRRRREAVPLWGSRGRQELVPRRGAAGGRAALGARPEAGRGGEPGGGGSLCPRVGAGREKEEEWIRREN